MDKRGSTKGITVGTSLLDSGVTIDSSNRVTIPARLFMDGSGATVAGTTLRYYTGGTPTFHSASITVDSLGHFAARNVGTEGSAYYGISNASNPNGVIYLQTQGSNRAVVASDGKFGIGTITPGAALQVTGGVAIASTTPAASDPGAGNLSVSGNAIVTGNLSAAKVS